MGYDNTTAEALAAVIRLIVDEEMQTVIALRDAAAHKCSCGCTADEKLLDLERQEADACEDAVDLFGIESQMLKAVEELNELGQALCKYIRSMKEMGSDDIHSCLISVKEEMADVHLLMLQLRFIFGDNRDMRKIKLEHLRQLIDGGGDDD